MTRPVSSAITTAIALPVTSPGYLVEMAFPSVFRASSRGVVNWNGSVFVPFGMAVTGLGSDGASASSTGRIVFDDLDNVLGTLILGQTFGGTTVTVWAFYNDPAAPDYTLGATDPTMVFQGYGGDCSFDINNGKVAITLTQANAQTLYLPRLYMTRENGFSFLPPRGTTIAWGNGQIVLQGE